MLIAGTGHLWTMFSIAPAAVTKKLGLGFSISVDILPFHFAPQSCTPSPGPQGPNSDLAPDPTCEDLDIFLNRRLYLNRILWHQQSWSFYPGLPQAVNR